MYIDGLWLVVGIILIIYFSYQSGLKSGYILGIRNERLRDTRHVPDDVDQISEELADHDIAYAESALDASSLVSTFIEDDGDDDKLVNQAAQLVIRTGHTSASLIQRRLHVGYAQASRVLDLLEVKGVVSKANGARPRDVLIRRMDEIR